MAKTVRVPKKLSPVFSEMNKRGRVIRNWENFDFKTARKIEKQINHATPYGNVFFFYDKPTKKVFGVKRGHIKLKKSKKNKNHDYFEIW
jgi:hypothetical protein